MKHIRKHSVFIGILLLSVTVASLAGVTIYDVSPTSDGVRPLPRNAGDPIRSYPIYAAPQWMLPAIDLLDYDSPHHVSVAAMDINGDGRVEILAARGQAMPDVYIPRRNLTLLHDGGSGWELQDTEMVCRPRAVGTSRRSILCEDPWGDMRTLVWQDDTLVERQE